MRMAKQECDLQHPEPNSVAAPVQAERPPLLLASAAAHLGRGALQLKLSRRLAQRKAAAEGPEQPETEVHEIAAQGVAGGGGALPHLDTIQRSFGDHDVSGITAHTDGTAARASQQIGAEAYATGDRVAFASSPSLHTAAHEAAHVVQQRGQVQLQGGVGQVGDRYEQHADAVADRVVQGQSAAGLLDEMTGATAHGGGQIQKEAQPGAVMDKPAGSLWAKGPDGKSLPPSLDDIAQGGLNDCFLFSAMAGIVNADPSRITKMIQDNGNGTYTVTFKGIGIFSSDTQTVSAEFVSGKHGNVKTGALWPLIIEKAYAQEKGGIDKLDTGGNGGDAVNDLTNDGPSRFDPRDKDADYILGKLQKAKDKGWPAMILSPKKDDASKDKKELADNTPGLHFWHGYTVIDVDMKGAADQAVQPVGQRPSQRHRLDGRSQVPHVLHRSSDQQLSASEG